MKSSLLILLVTLALGGGPRVLAVQLHHGEPPGQFLPEHVEEISVSDLRHEGLLMATQNDGPTLAEAIEMVRQQYRGRIISAQTKTNGDREVHQIKVLTEDGKVKTVRITGRSKRH